MAYTKFELLPSDVWQLLLQLFVATELQPLACAVLDPWVFEANIKPASRTTPMLPNSRKRLKEDILFLLLCNYVSSEAASKYPHSSGLSAGCNGIFQRGVCQIHARSGFPTKAQQDHILRTSTAS
jgi:hypothetical protein